MNTTLEFESVIIASLLFGHTHAHKQAERSRLLGQQPPVKTVEKSLLTAE